MQTIIYKLSVLLVIIGVLTSCFPDDKGSSTNLSFAIGEMRANAMGDGYLMMDDSTTMGLIPSLSVKDSVVNMRYYVEGYMADDKHSLPGYTYTMDAIALLPVAVDTVVEANTQEMVNALGADRYRLNANGLFVTGRYLNVFMNLSASGLNKHRIALMHNNVMSVMADEGDTVYVELCHNAHNDSQGREYRSILSFDLSKYVAAHPNGLVLGVWHYGNTLEKPKELTYFHVKQ